ncbi:MAG: hypothetical protein JKY65_25295, partial [Planctomycetes bacterium]|nr:hypothetical protein [Planctomycetota bacterium]
MTTRKASSKSERAKLETANSASLGCKLRASLGCKLREGQRGGAGMAGARAQPSVGGRRRFLLLSLIMVAACLLAVGVVTTVLYRHELDEHREHLQHSARSQARLVDAIARFDRETATRLPQTDPPYDPAKSAPKNNFAFRLSSTPQAA